MRRSVKHVARSVADRVDRLRRERGGVEPLIHGGVRDLRVAGQVRPVVAGAGVGPRRRVRDIERQTALPVGHPVDLPAREQLLGRAGERLAERQLVVGGEYYFVPDVEVGIESFGHADVVGRRLRPLRVREHVVRTDRQAVAVPPLEHQLQRVVGRLEVAGEQADGRHPWQLREVGAPLLNGAGRGGSQVQIRHHERDVRAARADIAGREHVAGEFLLGDHVELLDARVLEVLRHADDRPRRGHGVGRRRQRQAVRQAEVPSFL